MTVCITAASGCALNNLEVPAELSRKLRRADDYIRLAVVAAFNAMQDHCDSDNLRPDRCGLVLGSGFSTMQTNFEVLDSVVSGRQTSPTLFSHSVFNAAAGYVASTFNLQGAAFTVTDFAFPFFKALQEGYLAIISGKLDSCLVFHVETYSDLLTDGRKKRVKESAPWQPGVACLLLENKKMVSSAAPCLEDIEITRKTCAPEAFLVGQQDVIQGTESLILYDPLGAGILLTELLNEQGFRGGLFSVKSDWGETRLQLSI